MPVEIKYRTSRFRSVKPNMLQPFCSALGRVKTASLTCKRMHTHACNLSWSSACVDSRLHLNMVSKTWTGQTLVSQSTSCLKKFLPINCQSVQQFDGIRLQLNEPLSLLHSKQNHVNRQQKQLSGADWQFSLFKEKFLRLQTTQQ